MLQFWKKGGVGRGKNGPGNSTSTSMGSNPSTPTEPPVVNGGISYFPNGVCDPGKVGPLKGFQDEDLEHGDLGASESNENIHKNRSSKLSKTLREVLTDKSALAYFIQFMEARQKVGYIKFWLDAESFSAATKCLKLSNAEICPQSSVPWSVSKHSLENVIVGDSSSIASTEDGSMSPTVEKPDICSEIMLGKIAENGFEETTTVPSVLSRAESLMRDALIDAVRIYRKYLSGCATKSQAIQVPDAIRTAVVDYICREDGQVDSECFAQAQGFVYGLMEKEYFNEFLRSDFHCKHQIDVLTSGNVSLADILYNETALFHFAEFMEQEGHQSLLEFWLAATNFQQQLLEKVGAYDAMEAQNDAIVLYDKYFSLQATTPLGFSDKVRFNVEQNICREGGPLPDCFEQAARVVMRVLEKNFFHQFLSSQLYLKYLSELINMIQSSHSLLGRRTGSDCSSSGDLSMSSHSLTQGSEDHLAPRKLIHNVDEREMSIDSRQLYDPDSLWRRRHQSGLSFGRINELGRFETDFEPEPDRKGESRLTRVVKKFVNLEEDKAKEEMAWQIAAMIVKDVTSVTLGEKSQSPQTPTDRGPPLDS